MATSFKSTAKGGPEWGHVAGRVTVDDGTGEILDCSLLENMGRMREHARLPGGRCNTKTFLLYFNERPKVRVPVGQTSTPHLNCNIPDNFPTIFVGRGVVRV